MTCGEAREYLFAFLDNELDASLSIGLQQHLDRCHDCAREAEVERAIRRELGENLDGQKVDPAPGAQALLRTMSRAAGQRSRFAKFGRRAALAASIVFLVIAGSATWLGLRDGWGEQRPNRFAEAVVADFEHFLSEGRTLQLVSTDRETVAAWLRRETGLDIREPLPQGPHCRLVGARKCKLLGRTAAFAVYEMNGQTASLIVVDRKRADLDGMEQFDHEGKTHWVDRCKGHTVVACPRGDVVYAAVSVLPQHELIRLMSGAEHESD